MADTMTFPRLVFCDERAGVRIVERDYCCAMHEPGIDELCSKRFVVEMRTHDDALGVGAWSIIHEDTPPGSRMLAFLRNMAADLTCKGDLR